MAIDYNTIYNDTINASFTGLSSDTVTRLLRDGRAVSFFVYEYLLAKHELLRIEDDETPAQFVANGDGRVFHVRIVTEHGVSLNPSKQNGFGRIIDWHEHKERRDRLSGFLFVDVAEAPTIRYTIVPKMLVSGQKTHYGREAALTVMSLVPYTTLKDFEEPE